MNVEARTDRQNVMNMEELRAMEDVLMKIGLKIMGIRYGHAFAREGSNGGGLYWKPRSPQRTAVHGKK